jgi:hypothetical protein
MERIVRANILASLFDRSNARSDSAGIAEPKVALDPYYAVASILNSTSMVLTLDVVTYMDT